MIFDGNFDAADAAIYGGVLGFVEESVKAEAESDQEFDEKADEAIETYVGNEKADTQLRLLYNDNPGLVHHLIKKAYIVRAKAKERIKDKEIEAVRKEMLEELKELEEQENVER